MATRLAQYWVYGAGLAGVLLLVLTPVIARSWTAPSVVTFMALAAYMLHQYEEHENDRFRLLVNRILGGGREALTLWDVFVINVPIVWGVMALSFAVTSTVHPGYALIAMYVLLVNAIAHTAHAVLFRMYNPGLASALVLFFPLALYGLRVSGAGGVEWWMHGAALAGALGAHAGIGLRARFCLARSVRGAVD